MGRRYRRRHDDFAKAVFIMILMIVGWWTTNVGSLRSLGITVVSIIVGLIGLRFWLRRQRRLRLERSGINEVDCMSGEQFEQFLAGYFRRTGCRVKVTPPQGDYGADLLVERQGALVVVQAKRWNRAVGVDAVQQATAAAGYYKANSAMVVTNNYFTRNAKNLARANGVELWDRDILIQRLLTDDIEKKSVEKQRVEIGEIAQQTVCPRCGSVLVRKSGKYGEFWGCPRYPDCRYTVQA